MGWTQDGSMEVECLPADWHWGHLPPIYKEIRKDSEIKKASLNSGNRRKRMDKKKGGDRVSQSHPGHLELEARTIR